MERAIKDLCQLSDPELFSEVSMGIGHILKSVARLDTAAEMLSSRELQHPSRILSGLAEEEAAKALILMDAIRCPRIHSGERSRTLGYFYDHLAKGIYAEVCGWHPADFGEVIEGIDQLRIEHFLDGFNEVDWIVPNQIIQSREDDLYVSYVRDDTEDAGKGPRYWTHQLDDDLIPYFRPAIVGVLHALVAVGATTPAGLATVASLWRGVSLKRETTSRELEGYNFQMLHALEAQGQLVDQPEHLYATIRSRTPFPLWSLDLHVKKVAKNQLREVRRRKLDEDSEPDNNYD